MNSKGKHTEAERVRVYFTASRWPGHHLVNWEVCAAGDQGPLETRRTGNLAMTELLRGDWRILANFVAQAVEDIIAERWDDDAVTGYETFASVLRREELPRD